MCGISGIYANRERVPAAWIKQMADVLIHRGPDDEGYLSVNTASGAITHLTGPDTAVQGPRIETFTGTGNLLLGHRRLSILDPTPSGHQPMSNADGTIWAVYNGEIYNYMELKQELQQSGIRFRTRTDTEVLIAAYERWGEDCLHRFNGMWAFVIYDKRRNVLFGARDRFGVKPLYYFLDHEHFAFASEIKALLKVPFIKKIVNPGAVFDYLVLGLEEREEEGFWRNIFELQPSFAFRFDLSANAMQKWKYYSLAYIDEWREYDENVFSEYLTNVRQLITEAITLRLRSDVPVGSCLSGGIDSSSIVCVINSLLQNEEMPQIGEKQHVFTAVYDDPSTDERRWAKTVVESTKTQWHQVSPISSELLEDIHDLIYAQDIPFGSTSIYAQYRVMKLARESGMKVLLDGQGGDEVFTGYKSFYGVFAVEMLKNFSIGRFMQEWNSLDNAPVDRKGLLTYMAKVVGAKSMPLALKKLAYKSMNKETAYLNQDFWREHSHRIEIVGDIVKTSLNRMLHEYASGHKLKALLRYEDRNSMRFSIESRTPFADDTPLIEYLFQVPSSYKIRFGWSKYLLREATKGLLPEEIRMRNDKIGFATPEHLWLKDLSADLKSHITDHASSFIDTRKLIRDWDTLVAEQPSEGITTLWRFINFSMWMKVYSA